MLTLSKGMLIESNLVSTYIIKVESFENEICRLNSFLKTVIHDCLTIGIVNISKLIQWATYKI